MRLTVFGSGSKGNCYLLHNQEEALMLEAGIPFSKVLKGCKKMPHLLGCLVTHEHKDHAGYVNDLCDYGVRVWMTDGTKNSLKLRSRISSPKVLKGYPGHAAEPEYEMMKVGGFTIKPFATIHDAKEPVGFLIHHAEIGKMIFATDTNYLPIKLPKGINNLMVECNFDDELLTQRADIPEETKERIRDNHMSIDTCLEVMRQNDTSTINNIVLMHLSEGDGDPEAFGRQVAEITNKTVHIAKAGLDIEFNVSPF